MVDTAFLRDMLRRLCADFDLEDVARDLLRPLLCASGCDRAVMCAFSPEEKLVAIVVEGVSAPVTPDEEVEALASLVKAAIDVNRYVGTDDAAKDEQFRDVAHATGLRARRLAAVPLPGRDRPMGALALYGEKPGFLSEETTQLLVDSALLLAGAIETARLRRMQPVDEATGLPTDRVLLGRLDDEISRATRSGRSVTLVELAVERDGGGETLRTVAGILRKRIRPTDLAARSADGDRRFHILLPEGDRHAAVELGEKIRADLSAASLPASLGIASVPEDAVDAATLLLTAGEALDRARRAGGAVYDTSGPAKSGQATPVERVLAAREGRALEGMLHRVFSGDLDLQAQLDLALSIVASAIDAPKAYLCVHGDDEATAFATIGLTPADLGDLVRRDATGVSRKGDRIAIPILESDQPLAMLVVEKKLNDYEENVLQALAARMGAELAASVRLQQRRRELRERQESLARAVAELREKYDFREIVGSGPALLEVLRIVARAAETDAPVLITGESGTGKELIARAVHANSPRRQQSVVTLNCAALPATLLEGELFGHVKGSFTTATSDRKGLFESADKGTIFLDEIAEISIETQAKLLRSIQFGEIQRVGSDRMIQVDVRIIAASNRDLESEVAGNRFRQDLFYRLNVFRVPVPPLRDHLEDIPALVAHYCAKYAPRFQRKKIVPEAAVIEALAKYRFPGNVRELENILMRAIAMSTGETLTLRDLPAELPVRKARGVQTFGPARSWDELEQAKAVDKAAREKEYVEGLLRESAGNVSEAARRANMARSWLNRIMSRHHIDPRKFKP